MPDTERSLADLTGTLFADAQPAGSITPQDLRDLITSFTPPYGGLYFSTAASTSISTPGTYVKAAGTTTATNVRNFTMPVNNRLTYAGIIDRHFHLVLSFSLTTVGTNDNISVGIAKNGTVLDHTKLTRFMATGADQGAAASHGDVLLSTNDYIEVFVTNEDAAAAVTIQQGYLFATGMIM